MHSMLGTRARRCVGFPATGYQRPENQYTLSLFMAEVDPWIPADPASLPAGALLDGSAGHPYLLAPTDGGEGWLQG